MKNNIKLMTYEEWENLSGGKLKDGPFMSAKDKAADFLKLHNVDIYDEIYKINKKEYKLYLEMEYVDNERGFEEL